MIKAIDYNITAFCGVIALLNAWSLPASAETPLHRPGPSLPVSAETPLHRADLTFADVVHLGPPPFNTRIKNNLEKLERICTSGDGGACHTLGQAMMEHQYAVEASVLRYYKAACDAGHADGCYELGRMVMQSEGNPDPDAAILLFSRGCDGGSAAACRSKAALLDNGKLLPQECMQSQVSRRGNEPLRIQGVEFAAPSRNCRSPKAQ